MTVTLSAEAEQLVRDLLARDPERSPEELVEKGLHALAVECAPKRTMRDLTDAEFEGWLEELGAFADRIPTFEGETFSRERIYRDSN